MGCPVFRLACVGNKTTHVAAMVGASGRVLAFDKDPKRLKRLRDNVERAGAGGIVTARCADFLALDTSAPEFAEVGWRGERSRMACVKAACTSVGWVVGWVWMESGVESSVQAGRISAGWQAPTFSVPMLG